MMGESIEPSKVAKRWNDLGFSFGIFTDPPGQVWKDFVHHTDELFMVIQGEMELEMEGRKTRCGIGKEVRIPANVAHTARNVGNDWVPSQWLYGYKREE